MDTISPFIQFGSFGVLCWVIWWIVARHLPKQSEQQQVALTEQRDAFTTSLDKVTTEMTAQRVAYQEESKQNRHAFAQQIQQRDNEIDKQRDRTIDVLINRQQQAK